MAEIVAIVASLVVYWLYAMWSSKPANAHREEFALGNRDLGPFLIGSGLSMTFVGGAATVSMSGLGYQYGYQALIDPISVLLGLGLAAVLVRRYRADQFHTISESLSGTAGPLLWIVAGVSVVFYTLLMAANIAAFTKVVTPFIPLHPAALSIAGAVIAASYTLRSGIMSVTRTDVVQLIAVLGFFVLPCLFIINMQSSSVDAAGDFASIPPNVALLLGFTFLLCPVLQDVKIRAQAAKSESAARSGILLAALFYFLIVATAIWAGRSMALSGLIVEDPEKVLPTAFNMAFGGAAVIFVIGVLAAILSTLDGFALAGITTAQALPLRLATRPRAAVLIGLILFGSALSIAVLFPKVLSLVLLALLLYVSVLGPVAVGRLLGVSEGRLALIAVVFLVAASAVYAWGFQPVPYAAMFPMTHLLLVLLVSALPAAGRAAGEHGEG